MLRKFERAAFFYTAFTEIYTTWSAYAEGWIHGGLAWLITLVILAVIKFRADTLPPT